MQGKVNTVLTIACPHSLQHLVKSLVIQTERYNCEMVGISHPDVLSNGSYMTFLLIDKEQNIINIIMTLIKSNEW